MCELCAAREQDPAGSMQLENTMISAEFVYSEVYLSAYTDYPEPDQISVQISYCPFCGQKF